jgi:hypothetical protein
MPKINPKYLDFPASKWYDYGDFEEPRQTFFEAPALGVRMLLWR